MLLLQHIQHIKWLLLKNHYTTIYLYPPIKLYTAYMRIPLSMAAIYSLICVLTLSYCTRRAAL